MLNLFLDEKPFEPKNPPAPVLVQSTQDNGLSLIGKIFRIISNIVIIYSLHMPIGDLFTFLRFYVARDFFYFDWVPHEIGTVIYLVFFPIVAVFVIIESFSKKLSGLTSWGKFRLIGSIIILIYITYVILTLRVIG